MAHLLRCEKETVINFNDEDSVAHISSSQDWMKNRLHKLVDKNPDDTKITHEDEYTIIVEVPKKWISIRPPRKVSEKQRQEAAERLKAYRERKNMDNDAK